MKVAIVDDDASILKALSIALFEYEVVTFTDLDNFKNCSGVYDLLICDFDFGSYTLIEYLSQRKIHVPLFVITGKATKQVVIELLNLGVDFLIEKPLEVGLLKEKIKNLKRTEMDIHKIGLELGLVISPKTHEIETNKEFVKLTPTEYKILKFFIGHLNQVIDRSTLEGIIWPEVTVSKNTLDTHLLNLKRKVPFLKANLVSLYGSGLILKRSFQKKVVESNANEIAQN